MENIRYAQAMNDAEFHRQLVNNCSWWRKPRDWELDDPDLRGIRDSRLDYEPAVLKDIVPDGLYVLRGPRRVGKSVEVKRAIAGLIHSGVQPRQIIHFACDGLRARELRQVERVGRDQATAGVEGPRYWFLDEITAVEGWPSEIKWLRDNTAMREDCVVLTGSSSLDLDEARNELAGRRGGAGRSDRLLLPMSFRSFFAQLHHDSPTGHPSYARRIFSAVSVRRPSSSSSPGWTSSPPHGRSTADVGAFPQRWKPRSRTAR